MILIVWTISTDYGWYFFVARTSKRISLTTVTASYRCYIDGIDVNYIFVFLVSPFATDSLQKLCQKSNGVWVWYIQRQYEYRFEESFEDRTFTETLLQRYNIKIHNQ